MARGLYIVPTQSCFGESLPSEYVIAEKLYIENDKGYASGPTFLNQIGICTWMPKMTYIKSNDFQYNRVVKLKGFVVDNPHTVINKDNKKYLQILDSIEDMQRYAYDHERPLEIIFHYIMQHQLDTTILLMLGRKYYNKYVMNQLYLMMEYYEST